MEQSTRDEPRDEPRDEHGEMVGGASRKAFAIRRGRVAEMGQSMVEVAFLLPLFLGLVFAIIEIGRAWAAKQSLTIAAREGARVLVLPYGAGLTYTSESDVQTAARNAVTSYLTSSGVPVGAGTQITIVRVSPGNDFVYGTPDDAIEPNYSQGKRGERVGIQITHGFESPLPLILGMFNNAGGQQGQSGAAGINMGVACYMEHE